MSRLFIIPGHGAGDCGAVGNGYQEAERVRALATKIKEYGGDDVILSDFSLNSYKSNIIGKGLIPKDCIILELHLDSHTNGNANGGHIIINGNFKADKYDNALAKTISTMFPGRRKTIVGRTDLANVKRAAAKGYNYRLMECCFVSNKDDIEKFSDNIDELAKKILECFEIAIIPIETKWIKDDIGWWYRHSDGSFTKNGWEKIGEEWYYFDIDGYTVKEKTWLKIDNKWYYFNERNAAVKGYHIINGILYYFAEKSAGLISECQLIMTNTNGEILPTV